MYSIMLGKKGGERIEVFSVNTRTTAENQKEVYLDHQFSFIFGAKYDGIFNNLALLSDGEFLITQFLQKPGSLVDGLSNPDLAKQTTYVFHCSVRRRSCRTLMETKGIMNNGITLDTKNKRVFVADSLKGVIKSYDFMTNRSTGLFSLRLRKEIKLDYFPDNVEYDRLTGEVYIGAFKSAEEILEFANTLKETKTFPTDLRAQSGLLSLDTKNDKVTPLVMQDQFLFVSAGYKKDKKVFMGSAFDEGIYVCTLS